MRGVVKADADFLKLSLLTFQVANFMKDQQKKMVLDLEAWARYVCFYLSLLRQWLNESKLLMDYDFFKL